MANFMRVYACDTSRATQRLGPRVIDEIPDLVGEEPT